MQNAISSAAKLQTYSQISSLGANEVKKLCLVNGVDSKLPKKARVILLSHVLGISTSGHAFPHQTEAYNHLTQNQVKELSTLTPKYMCTVQGWTSDLTTLPDIEDKEIKKYLVSANVLTAKDARSYKLTRPFALRDFVHSLNYLDNPASETFGIVRAQCNPSQSASADDIKVVFVIIDKISGEPHGGFCTCTVGQSEKCGHVGAVLFKVSELQATGATEGPSCTEVRCKWADPKDSKSEPSLFSEIKIKKTEKKSSRTIEDYGQKLSKTTPPTYDAVAALRARLLDATHHLKDYCQAVHILNCERFQTEKTSDEPKIIQTIPQRVPYDCDLIAYAKEEEVNTTPILVTEIAAKKFTDINEPGYSEAVESLFKEAANLSIDIEEVDRLTVGQADNKVWLQQRGGCVTTSKMAKVIKAVEGNSSNVNKLAEDIIGCEHQVDTLKHVPSIKWGRKNEAKARQQYEDKFSKFHHGFNIQRHGLMVYKECTFIRGSPDGIVECVCHGRRIIEIKCPYSARTLTVSEGVAQGKIKYLEKTNDKYRLKENSADGYFAQMQGMMGISGVHNSNLVVWTPREMVTVHVPFQEEFFLNKIVPACKVFFKEHVIPRLLLEEPLLMPSLNRVGDHLHQTNSLEPAKMSKVPLLEKSPEQPAKLRKVTLHEKMKQTSKLMNVPPHEKSLPKKLKKIPSHKKSPEQPNKLRNIPQHKSATVSSENKENSVVRKIALPPCTPNSASVGTCAENILKETSTTYKCKQCYKILPDEDVLPDNSNASVGCDCPNCGCDTWMCWPCAKYDEEWADEKYDWYCPSCTRDCDIIM